MIMYYKHALLSNNKSSCVVWNYSLVRISVVCNSNNDIYSSQNLVEMGKSHYYKNNFRRHDLLINGGGHKVLQSPKILSALRRWSGHLRRHHKNNGLYKSICRGRLPMKMMAIFRGGPLKRPVSEKRSEA